MLFIFMEMYCKELSKAYKDIARSTEAAIKGESKYRESVKVRETKMAEADGVEMDEEEIEQTVDIITKSSPYRRKIEEDLKRTLRVMKNG